MVHLVLLQLYNFHHWVTFLHSFPSLHLPVALRYEYSFFSVVGGESLLLGLSGWYLLSVHLWRQVSTLSLTFLCKMAKEFLVSFAPFLVPQGLLLRVHR